MDNDHIIRRADARAVGITDRQLMARVSAGELVKIAPGSYVVDTPRTPEALHRLAIMAADDLALPISHASAGAVHGLGMLSPDLRRIHVTNGSASGGRIHPTRHVHSGSLDADDVVQVDGVWVTSLARTAVDVACSGGGFDHALVVVDSALRRGARREDMARILETRRRRGSAAARAALDVSDGRAESVGESWCRAQIISAPAAAASAPR